MRRRKFVEEEAIMKTRREGLLLLWWLRLRLLRTRRGVSMIHWLPWQSTTSLMGWMNRKYCHGGDLLYYSNRSSRRYPLVFITRAIMENLLLRHHHHLHRKKISHPTVLLREAVVEEIGLGVRKRQRKFQRWLYLLPII